ncbi:hypothetical protein Avbf_11341 [Armadillidium vulgare]|nr:hypothetical protein Avbf_11341 [Armadillidium vulgare]
MAKESLTEKEISVVVIGITLHMRAKFQRQNRRKEKCISQTKIPEIGDGHFIEQILNGTSAKMWYSAKYMGENSYKDYMDTTHLPDYNNYNLMQILFNMMCNKIMTLSPEYCCT